MALSWTELAPVDQPRDPLADFAVNAMARFTAADLDLSTENPSPERKSEYDDQWWLALVTVARGDDKVSSLTINELVRKAKDHYTKPLDNDLLIPGEYDGAFRESTDLDVITIYAKRAYINAVNAQDGEDSLGIESIEVSFPLDSNTVNPSITEIAPIEMDLAVSDQTVVTAVIDHGIAIAHDLFRREDATGALALSRVDFFLDMDGTSDPNAPIQSTVGRVWTRDEIEQILSANLHNGLLDEANVYRALGLIDWRRRSINSCAHRVSHGTHVTGLAAGYDADDAKGVERRIIAVQLPTRLVANTMGQWLQQALEQALTFIARQMEHYTVGGAAQATPLVMNFSFGNFMGPHDGTSRIDRAIDGNLSKMAANSNRPRVLMLPSGNGNLSRCHAIVNLTNAVPTKELDWNLQPADRSASILTAWLPVMTPVKNGTVEMQVTVPGFSTPHTIIAGTAPGLTLLRDTNSSGVKVIVGMVVYSPPRFPTNRGRFEIYLVPTDHPVDVRPVARAGAWKLRFTKATSASDLSLNIWVQRDDTLPGFPQFGRQSYLSDGLYDRFSRPGGAVISDDALDHDSAVYRSGMINGIACGNLPAVIAGYVRSDRKMAVYSAGGPTLNAFRLPGPDASATSDDSVVLQGVLSAGSSSGSRVAMNGTSVSAPQVARWAADQIALSPTTPFTRASVTAKALNDDTAGMDKPGLTRTGGGRMKLGSVFGDLRWSEQ